MHRIIKGVCVTDKTNFIEQVNQIRKRSKMVTIVNFLEKTDMWGGHVFFYNAGQIDPMVLLT